MRDVLYLTAVLNRLDVVVVVVIVVVVVVVVVLVLVCSVI